MRYKRLLLTLLPALLLVGCVPKTDKAVTIPDAAIRGDLEKNLDLFGDKDAHLVADWWRGYGDPQLNTIVEKGLFEAPSLKSVEARYAQANAIIQSVQSRNLPQISANASLIRERFSANHIFPEPLGGSTNTQYQPALTLDYDFDFWNERSSRILAAKNGALAQRASLEAAKVALSSAICATYLSWNYDEQKLAVLSALEQINREELAIVEKQYRLGLIDGVEINTKKSANSQIAQQAAQLKRTIEGKKETLCVLAGFLPSYTERMTVPHIRNGFSPPLPKEIMLDLLAHRPDVAIAKYTVLSKRHTIEQRKAAFYPNISLSGLIGFTSFSWAKLLDRSSYSPSAGISLSLPLLDWGERNANLQNSVSDYNSSAYEYNRAVINAANEVVVLLKQSKLVQSQIAFHHEDINAKKANETIARKKFFLGLSNKLPYLSAKKMALEGELEAHSLNETHALIQVDLIKALGGGYSDKEDKNESL